MSERIKQGDPAPTGPCVHKALADGTYAVKVSYLDDEKRQLYAIFAWHAGPPRALRATGEHLTLPQVLSRGN